ncbi:threonine synthase [Roseibium sp.]|uniref:threonine synthase n=1 Tax=Roseibium sp. TaxID=1936156 RepID=UPI003A96965C
MTVQAPATAATAVTRNPDLSGFQCLKCEALLPVDDYPSGCPACWQRGAASNVVAVYADKAAVRLPYLQLPRLGEGNTRLLACPPDLVGRDNVYLKCEFDNPTGSHKDRCSAFSVARALERGDHTVIAASSGNAGISLAAYARNAGLACEIAVTDSIAPVYRDELQRLGATSLSFAEARARWDWMAERAQDDGVYAATNYCVPAVGSSPFGIEGYKLIAHEIYTQLGKAMPSAVAVPHCRGDVLSGIFYGFREVTEEAQAVPQILPVDPFARTERILSGELDYRDMCPGDAALLPAVGGETTTWQSVNTAQQSRAGATTVSGDEAEAMRLKMLEFGFDLERSAVMSVVALKRLVESGTADADRPMVALLTGVGRPGI